MASRHRSPVPLCQHRVRARFVQKCTVRDASLMVADHSGYRASVRSFSAGGFRHSPGAFGAPLSLFQGLSWRGEPPRIRAVPDRQRPATWGTNMAV